MMNSARTIRTGFSQWIDSTATAVARLGEHFKPPRTVRLEQKTGDEFAIQHSDVGDVTSAAHSFRMAPTNPAIDHPASLTDAITGAHVELTLQSDHFLFCPLELPRRAREFLPGIVRAQIDRLTPWNAGAAAFGWSKPIETSGERITVIIAATALGFVEPYCDILAKLGAHSITVFTSPTSSDEAATPIKVWDQRVRDTAEIAKTRKILAMTLAVCLVAAASTAFAATIIDTYLDSAQDDVAQKLAGVRGAGRTTGGPINAKRALERRKYETPSTVLVLDALSDILPDHTYVTELRIEGSKVQLSGLTRDAPSLIELIERSGRFTRASFFGPTTRSDSEPGERFHIEATIQPLKAERS